MTDITKPSEVRRIRKKHRLTEQQKRSDFKELMQAPAFQRIARELLGWCHVFQSSYDPDVSVMAFKEGERNIGLRLQSELELANPTLFHTHILLPGAQERVAEARKAEEAQHAEG